MKREKRVRQAGRVARLWASEGAGGGVERERSTRDRESWREWAERQAELKRWRQVPKKRVTLNLDADVLAWFRELGRGYQWEMNRALRKVMVEEERKGHGISPVKPA